MDTKTNDTQPIFSRCSLGNGRWFWVAYASFEDMCEGNIHASGYSDTSDAAEAHAKTAILNDSPRQFAASHAQDVHRRMCAKQRARKTSSSDSTAKLEYVYSYYTSDYDGSWGSTPYRIIKKTAKRIYVETICPYKWTDEDGVYYDVETFVLDRDKLEREGFAWSRPRRNYFYLLPHEERHESPVPRCLAVLELTHCSSCTDIDTAYRRLALKHHPDRGGDVERFRCIHRAYEEALGFCST